MSHLYENVARWSLYLLALLVPLMYLPWTVDRLEIHKQTITLLLVSVAVIAWLGLMVSAKQFFLKKSWIFLLAIGFLISALISSALSIAPVTSWIGQSTQEYTSFVTLLAFVMMFILGAHFLDETKSQRVVWTLSFVASSIISIFSFFVVLGHPLVNTLFVGTPNALGLYLATMAVLGCGLWLVSGDKGGTAVLPKAGFGIFVKVLIVITVMGTLFTLLALDYTVLWVALLVGLVVLFTFALYRAHEFPHMSHFVLPMLLFVVALFLVFLPSPLKNTFPVEVSPSGSSSQTVAMGSLRDTSVLFGSGPGTFVMDYTKYKDESVNQTALWDTRFDRANSQFFTLLATFGILGIGLFLAFVVSLAAVTKMQLLKRQQSEEWKMTCVTFTAWSVLVVGMFVYSSNFTLSFLFWFLSAVLVSQMGPAVKHIGFTQSPRGALLTTFLFVLVSVGLLTLVFVTVSRYAAEITFANAIRADREDQEIDSIIVGLDNAAQLNRWSDLYYRNLASALLVKTSEFLANESPDTAQLQQYVALTISSAVRANDISPSYVVNAAMLGDIYRELVPLVGGAEVLAIDAYESAIALAPSNPKYYTVQANAYLIHAEALARFLESEDETAAAEAASEQTMALDSAEAQLLKAIELKPDYAPAHYALAVVYERQGNLAEAISSMLILSESHPLDVGVHFQLGLLYQKQGKFVEAQASLEKAVEIAPNYSNALWFLASVYEQQGDVEAAIEQVEKILELNPDNQVVKDRLAELAAGTVAEVIPAPLEEGEPEVEIE